MDRLIEDFFGEFPAERVLPERMRVPSVDVVDRPNDILVRAEMPGMTKESIRVDATPESLTLCGEMKEEKEERGEQFYRRERRMGMYQRVIPLPVQIKPSEVKARYKDGILEVTLPKTEEAKTQQPVKVSIE
jgi:HSP20 family protein